MPDNGQNLSNTGCKDQCVLGDFSKASFSALYPPKRDNIITVTIMLITIKRSRSLSSLINADTKKLIRNDRER
jgi:hypothetical protein